MRIQSFLYNYLAETKFAWIRYIILIGIPGYLETVLPRNNICQNSQFYIEPGNIQH